MTESLKQVIKLCDDYLKTHDPKMKWMWGEGILGYALLCLDEYNNEQRYRDFLVAYCEYYLKNPPQVDQSDRFAPVLIPYLVGKLTGNGKYQDLAERGLDYLAHAPRILGDSPNHLGTSFVGKFYPKSIWVDSLMMYALFPSLYGKRENNTAFLKKSAKTIVDYAGYLQDPADKLWYHAYWVKSKKAYPRGDLYWGRGNGWVLCSLPLILANLKGANDPEIQSYRREIIRILQDTAEALLPLQREDGMFNTLLKRKSYPETSATLLIASGFLQGALDGYLDRKFLEAGIRAYERAVKQIKEDANGYLYLDGISAPTIPLQVFPRLGYLLIPRGRNWSYGIAALILATIQYDRSGGKL
jgi:unsaturated rhamnogalacturonyl hydrolase